MRRISKTRRGSIVVLAAFLLVVVVGMVAFAVDLGCITNTRSELQNVADAAALAGASQLMDRNTLRGSSTSASRIAAIAAEAQSYAQMNMAGGVYITLAPNSTNSMGGDVVVGYLANPSDPANTMTTTAAQYNAVAVTARRTSQQNGSLPLFFAPVFGRKSSDLTATATAVYQGQVNGFKITGNNPNVQYSKLLPFAMNVSTWTPVANGTGTDTFAYASGTKTVTAGSDGIKEAKLYGGKTTAPGNFGTVNIGNPNNSTADITRQILYGPNKSDFDYLGGSFQLDSSGTTVVSGDPGLSVGFRLALESIVGQPRIIPLYSSLTGNGANAKYTIVGFAGVVITSVRLTGPNKSVTIQPEFVVDATAVGGGPSSTANSFIYRPLQLAR